jgi:ParB/RepB/Spo0J family partition protein
VAKLKPRLLALDAPWRNVLLHLIDEPDLPVRVTMDPDGLQELAESIKQLGILEPLLLEEHNGRYKCLAGHRRLLAARIARLNLAPAVVWPAGMCDAAAILAHENTYRENVNPADEAVWMQTMLEKDCGGDVDELCARLHQKRAYVEGRLILLRGDEQVFNAVQRGAIALAVAAELNKYSDPTFRHMRLQSAEAGGATARMVREWRRNDEGLIDAYNQAVAAEAGAAPPPPVALEGALLCSICGQGDQPHRLRLQYVHDFCEEGAKRFGGMLNARPEIV